MKFVPPVNNLGVVYNKLGKFQKALAAFKKAEGMSSFSATPTFNLAQLYLRLGDSKSSQVWDAIARSMPPDDPWPDTYTNELQPFILGREQRFTEVDRLQKQRR